MIQLFKRTSIILMVLAYCISCNTKENQSGIKVHANGLTYDNIVLRLNKDTLKSNEVDFDKDIIMNIIGLKGFKETFGNIYIGCSLVITDETGKEIMKYKDLYSYYDVPGISAADIKNKFSISLNLQTPMKRGATYVWESKIWDKKGKGELHTEMKFKIKNAAK